MSGYVWSRISLFSHAEVLAFAAIAVSLLGFAAAALSYLGHYATPERVRIRPWVPIPDDLPDRPSHLRVMYGASDLKSRYRGFMLDGVSGATFLHAVVIGTLLIAAALSTKPPLPMPDDRWKNAPDLFDSPLEQMHMEGTPGVSWGNDRPLPPPPSPALSNPVPVPDSEAPLLREFDADDVGINGPFGTDIWGERKGDGGNPAPDLKSLFAPPREHEEQPFTGVAETMPVLVTMDEPVYPPMAREAGIEGDIEVRALIGKDGRVRDVRLMNSIPMLDESAKTAARTGIYKPACWNGEPVSVWVEFTINFQLR